MDIPEIGSALTVPQALAMFEAINYRQQKYNELFEESLLVVLFNFGSRFDEVNCINGEWHGHKQDLECAPGIPKCPNGHVLLEKPGLRLGWVEEQI